MASGMSAERLQRVTRAVAAAVEQGEIAGAVTRIFRKGALAHGEAVGWQDDAARTPVAQDTLFRIASMTKPVASVAALMLMEEGRFALNDPIDRFLPEFADPKVLRDPAGPLDDTVRASRKITILDLLTHRPGFASNYTAQGPIAAKLRELRSASGLQRIGRDPDDWLARLGALPLVQEPGSHFIYGFATDVLGLLVGRVSGLGLPGFLESRLFGPLGMKDTGFHVPAAKLPRLSVAYATDPRTGKRVVEDHPATSQWAAPPAVPSGSAGLVSTADDYLRFARMLLGKGALDGVRILSRKSVELMTENDFLTPEQRERLFFGTDMWSANGFGLGVWRLDNLAAQARPGSIGSYGWGGAYGTVWTNDPAEEMAMILMIQLLTGTVGTRLGIDFVDLAYQAIDD